MFPNHLFFFAPKQLCVERVRSKPQQQAIGK